MSSKLGDHMTVDQITAIDHANHAALDNATPQEILAWAAERYGKDITMACSFGGPTGMVLVDMVSKLGLDISVFYLDSDYLFPETHALVEATRERYGIEPKAYRARWSVEAQATEFGPRLWETNADLCCALRKVEPNGRALEGKQAWITGLRRDQSSTRKETKAIEWDAKFELVKVNPLVNWSDAQVWDYIRENGVPYNDLHDNGYPSIGCTNCTRAILAGEHSRAGRWSDSDKIECGIHVADDEAIEGATR
jgi:phosphoadenosine phosphosulfate reductase